VDPLVRDTIDLQLITSVGDREVLRLRETGPDTGVFAGGIQSTRIPPAQSPYDCKLLAGREYDAHHGLRRRHRRVDQSEDQAFVDPFGYAFDSSTGAWIDGAVVTIIDVNTGAPAAVFGDDGTTAFHRRSRPAAARRTRAARTTVSARRLPLPVVPSGTYRFVITPPPTHSAPSTVPPSTLANVRDPNNNPYVVVAGSFEDAFVLMPGPTLRVDLPLDPLARAGSCSRSRRRASRCRRAISCSTSCGCATRVRPPPPGCGSSTSCRSASATATARSAWAACVRPIP